MNFPNGFYSAAVLSYDSCQMLQTWHPEFESKLHCTLMYSPTTECSGYGEILIDSYIKSVVPCAKIVGVDVFNCNNGDKAVVLLLDSAWAVEANRLQGSLDTHVHTFKPYTPHITVKYITAEMDSIPGNTDAYVENLNQSPIIGSVVYFDKLYFEPIVEDWRP